MRMFLGIGSMLVMSLIIILVILKMVSNKNKDEVDKVTERINSFNSLKGIIK